MILPFSEFFQDGSKTNFENKIATGRKIHTIREDKSDRWKAGNKIHCYYNCRQINMRLIYPEMVCVSIQDIHISPDCYGKYTIFIDDISISDKDEKILALNDGFDSLDKFKEWFSEEFRGKIIHWTCLKY